MNSKQITSISFDFKKLENEIETILDFNYSSSYSEYAIGDWKTCMLWNKNGDINDGFSHEYSFGAKKTEYGEKTPYLNSVLEKLFNLNIVKSIRIFYAKNGIIIPHKDYLEFSKGFHRIHIPLQTDTDSFNSEGNEVYHMDIGEVWFLDGHNVHSGGSLSKKIRLHLVLDFSVDVELKDIFTNTNESHKTYQTNFIERMPFTNEDLDYILNLGNIINRYNFENIVSILAKVHFEKQVCSSEMFDWLIKLAMKSKNKALLDKANKMKKYYLG